MATKSFFLTRWLLLGFGAAFILLGLFSFIHPFIAFVRLVAYAGIVLFMDGILLAILAGQRIVKKEKNMFAAESAVNFFFAALLCFNPMLTFIALPLIMGGWLITTGFIKIFASLVLRKKLPAWPLISIAGCTAVLFGFLIIYNPIYKASGTVTLSGAFWLLMGLLYIIDALHFKKEATALSIML